MHYKHTPKELSCISNRIIVSADSNLVWLVNAWGTSIRGTIQRAEMLPSKTAMAKHPILGDLVRVLRWDLIFRDRAWLLYQIWCVGGDLVLIPKKPCNCETSWSHVYFRDQILYKRILKCLFQKKVAEYFWIHQPQNWNWSWMDFPFQINRVGWSK